MGVSMTADQLHSLTQFRLDQLWPERSGKRARMEVIIMIERVTSYLIVVPLYVGLELLFSTILVSLSFPSAVWNSSVV